VVNEKERIQTSHVVRRFRLTLAPFAFLPLSMTNDKCFLLRRTRAFKMNPIDIDGLHSFDTTHAPPRFPTSVTAIAAPRPQPARIYLPPSNSANTRVVYDSANGVNRLAGNSESLVIAITVKGKPSHFSVFFGPDSPFNCKGDVPKSIWGQEVRISLNFL
jgi:hypothetical protein